MLICLIWRAVAQGGTARWQGACHSKGTLTVSPVLADGPCCLYWRRAVAHVEQHAGGARAAGPVLRAGHLRHQVGRAHAVQRRPLPRAARPLRPHHERAARAAVACLGIPTDLSAVALLWLLGKLGKISSCSLLCTDDDSCMCMEAAEVACMLAAGTCGHWQIRAMTAWVAHRTPCMETQADKHLLHACAAGHPEHQPGHVLHAVRHGPGAFPLPAACNL